MRYNTLQHLDSPLNRSISKQAHAFSKADRFRLRQRMKTQMKYELPSTLDKKACGIGYGKKISLVSNSCSPSPGNYQIGSDFKQSRYFPKIPSFSRGRNEVKFMSYIQQAQSRAKMIPSPDKYDIRLPKNKLGGRIAERVATENIQKSNALLPGPGHYPQQGTSMSKNQSYVLSNFKKTISPRFYRQKVMSTYEKKNNTIFYEIAEKQFGKSRLSKFRNVSVSSFGSSKREGIVEKSKLLTPGFKYSIFSEFGLPKK